MEMAEEGMNEPKINPKRIKGEEEEEDRISALPDCLLVEILARLPSTDTAIRTGTLSKRWKYVWTSVPTLIFLQHVRHQRPFSDFVSFVDKTLIQCRQMKLRTFAIRTSRVDLIPFELQVDSWIRYAMSCNVEELHLKLCFQDSYPWGVVFRLNQDFFINPSFTHLDLSYCILNPKGAISWKSLRNLVIEGVKLEEDLMENIFTGSPVLETLMLDCCYGYSRLDITSKSLKKLVIQGYSVPGDEDWDFYDAIEINAPNILSITIKDQLWLRELLLLNVSSLVKANISFSIEGYDIKAEEVEKDMYRDFIRKLHNLKELKIKGRSFKGAYKRKLLKKYGLDRELKFMLSDSS